MGNVSIFRPKCPMWSPVPFHIWMVLEAPSFVGVPAQRLPPLRRFDPFRDRSQLLPLAAQETNVCPSPTQLTVHWHEKNRRDRRRRLAQECRQRKQNKNGKRDGNCDKRCFCHIHHAPCNCYPSQFWKSQREMIPDILCNSALILSHCVHIVSPAPEFPEGRRRRAAA